MVPRNSTQLLNINTTKFQVEREPVYCLPSCVNSKVRLFADDCLLYREIKHNQDQIDMQRDLDALMDWGSTWGMKFNAKSVTLCGSRVLANLCSISTV